MTARRPRKTDYVPESQRHTERITLRLPPEEAAWWRDEASRRGCKIAELVTEARAALEGHKRKGTSDER